MGPLYWGACLSQHQISLKILRKSEFLIPGGTKCGPQTPHQPQILRVPLLVWLKIPLKSREILKINQELSEIPLIS